MDCSHALHFYESCATKIFDKFRQVLRFLVDYYGLRWEDEMVLHSETKRMIATTIFEDNAIVYVKGREK